MLHAAEQFPSSLARVRDSGKGGGEAGGYNVILRRFHATGYCGMEPPMGNDTRPFNRQPSRLRAGFSVFRAGDGSRFDSSRAGEPSTAAWPRYRRRNNAGNFFIGAELIKSKKNRVRARARVRERQRCRRTSHGVNTSATADTPLSGARHAFPHYQGLPGASDPDPPSPPAAVLTQPQLTLARGSPRPCQPFGRP